MTPGTKVRTKVTIHGGREGVIVPANAEGVVQFIHQNLPYSIEVSFYGNYSTLLYRPDELEIIE